MDRNFANKNINKNLTYTANRQKPTGQGMTQGYISKPATPAVPAVVAAAAALSAAGTPPRAQRPVRGLTGIQRRPVTRNMGRQ